MRQRGQISLETAGAAIGAIGGAIAVVVALAGPAQWGGDVNARLHNVEAATVRIEGKVDQILLQRGGGK